MQVEFEMYNFISYIPESATCFTLIAINLNKYQRLNKINTGLISIYLAIYSMIKLHLLYRISTIYISCNSRKAMKKIIFSYKILSFKRFILLRLRRYISFITSSYVNCSNECSLQNIIVLFPLSIIIICLCFFNKTSISFDI